MLLADIPFELILVLVAALIGVISRLVEFTKKIRARVNAQMREKEQAEGIDLVGARKDETDLHEAPTRIRQRPAEFDLDPMWTGVPMPIPVEKKIPPRKSPKRPAAPPARLKLGIPDTEPHVAGRPKPTRPRSRPTAKSSKATTSTLLRTLKAEREGTSRRARRRRRRLGASLHDPAAVQRAVVLREILGPPRAARYLPHLTRR